MPRCQRTFRRLGPGETLPGSGAARWPCPHCPDAEVYETVRDDDLTQYAEMAGAACRRDFGAPSDAARPTLFLFGLRPECVLEAADRRYDVYLERGSDPLQLRLQIGHETFHRVCSQGRVFHWTHEMLACLASVRLLRALGFDGYAAEAEAEYVRQSERLDVFGLRYADVWSPPYPPGLYGRAYVTGKALADTLGWPALCRLARALDPRTGQPDLSRWLGRLSAGDASAAAAILGITGEQPCEPARR